MGVKFKLSSDSSEALLLELHHHNDEAFSTSHVCVVLGVIKQEWDYLIICFHDMCLLTAEVNKC